MFTGIIESLGEVTHLERKGTNLDITVRSAISRELKIDQSLAHNGVCLTVVELTDDTHTVTAIEETLQRTSIGELAVGSVVNLERAMRADARFDGHIVQGHVDATGIVDKVTDQDGSWRFYFKFEPHPDRLVVEKGSICIDGVSLTVVDAGVDHFSVAIIPYTYEHTSFRDYKPGSKVNLEFDIIGKYLARLSSAYNK